jgi:hypothetical protein
LVADSCGLDESKETGEQIMTQSVKRHRYSAHLRDEGTPGRQWVAEADSFIDAAVRFAETRDIVDGDVSVVVTDCESGKDRCFLVNLGSGDVKAC